MASSQASWFNSSAREKKHSVCRPPAIVSELGRGNASLIGTGIFYVDYCATIDQPRKKLQDIAENSKLWDRNVSNLAVTDFSERTMQVRCLVSRKNAPETLDLRCEVREKIIGPSKPTIRKRSDGSEWRAAPRAEKVSSLKLQGRVFVGPQGGSSALMRRRSKMSDMPPPTPPLEIPPIDVPPPTPTSPTDIS